MREHNRVHEFLWPRVFDFQSLLVLECFCCERPDDRNRYNGLQVVAECKTWSNDVRAKFVHDIRTAAGISADAGGEGTANLELEGEYVTTSFETVTMLLLAFKERPLVVTKDVVVG